MAPHCRLTNHQDPQTVLIEVGARGDLPGYRAASCLSNQRSHLLSVYPPSLTE